MHLLPCGMGTERLLVEWGANHQDRNDRHLRDQPTASQQANLAIKSPKVRRQSQTPLISVSGPKRYDFDPKTGQWVYEREGDTKCRTLHELLDRELSNLLGLSVKAPVPRPPPRD